MDLKTSVRSVDFAEANNRVNSLFWIVLKVLIFTGLLAAVAIDLVKYVIHAIYS